MPFLYLLDVDFVKGSGPLQFYGISSLDKNKKNHYLIVQDVYVGIFFFQVWVISPISLTSIMNK